MKQTDRKAAFKWKPKEGDEYFYLTHDAAGQYFVESKKHKGWVIDLLHVDCGNCFQNEKQAWTWAKKLNLAVQPILKQLSK